MSWTECCKIRYVGENHNPVGDDGFCIHCGAHPTLDIYEAISEIVPGIEPGMRLETANVLILRELKRLKKYEQVSS